MRSRASASVRDSVRYTLSTPATNPKTEKQPASTTGAVPSQPSSTRPNHQPSPIATTNDSSAGAQLPRRAHHVRVGLVEAGHSRPFTKPRRTRRYTKHTERSSWSSCSSSLRDESWDSAQRGGNRGGAERARRRLRHLEQQPRIDAEHERRQRRRRRARPPAPGWSSARDPIVSFFRYMKTTMRM